MDSVEFSLIALFTVVAVFLTVGSTHLEGLRWDYDEGVHAMEASLVLAGFSLYREVYSSDMPLFIASLAAAFDLLGSSINTARAVALLYATIGLLSIGLFARLLGGKWTGVVTALILAVSPSFFHGARVCWDDIPSLSMATCAGVLAFLYDRSGSRLWLALSGLSYGIALSLKLLVVPVSPVLILLSARRHLRRSPNIRQLLAATATFLVSCGLVLLLVFASLDLQAAFEQLILFPNQAAEAYAWSRSRNWLRVLNFLTTDNAAITIMAVFGLWAGASRPQIVIWPVATWLLSSGLALLVHVPLWPHLLISLLFPLVVLAGIGLAQASKLLFKQDYRNLQWWISLSVVGAFAVTLSRSIAADANSLKAPSPSSALHAIEWLKDSTAEDAVILTDEALIPFVAGRRVPPSLTDTSFKRITSGMLTAEDVIEVANAHRPPAVVLWQDGRFQGLPELVTWIDSQYRSEIKYGDGTRLLFDPIWRMEDE